MLSQACECTYAIIAMQLRTNQDGDTESPFWNRERTSVSSLVLSKTCLVWESERRRAPNTGQVNERGNRLKTNAAKRMSRVFR